jgi:hypothetical protein
VPKLCCIAGPWRHIPAKFDKKQKQGMPGNHALKAVLSDELQRFVCDIYCEVHKKADEKDALLRAKSIIFLVGEGADEQPLCVVCCGDDKINTKKVARYQGERKIRLCSPQVR